MQVLDTKLAQKNICLLFSFPLAVYVEHQAKSSFRITYNHRVNESTRWGVPGVHEMKPQKRNLGCRWNSNLRF